MTRHRLLFVGSIVAGALQVPLQQARLPERMAAHFNLAGEPDGWMSRGAFAAVSSAVVLVVGAILAGVFALIRRLPDRYFSLPRRDYWLAPERRASTIGFLDRRLSWLGIATLLLLMVLAQLVIRANLSGDPRLPAFLPLFLLGPYLILVGVLAFRTQSTLARGGGAGGGVDAG